MKKLLLMLLAALVLISGCNTMPEKEPGYEVKIPLERF